MLSFIDSLSKELGDFSEFDFPKSASVCLLIRPSKKSGLFDLLYMERSVAPGDHWSGQIGFPGGKRDPEDESNLAAGVREFHEEMGINLEKDATYLGDLSSVQGRRAGTELKFCIYPFVFYTDKELSFNLDPSEVADYFWVPAEKIVDPKHFKHYPLKHSGKEIYLPGIAFPKQKTLWGLTYMMTLDFFQRMAGLKEIKDLHKKIVGDEVDYLAHLTPYP